MKNRNHKLLYILIFGYLLISSCTNSITNSTFNHNNLERSYVLYKPIDIPDNAPLVFVLHSYGRYANEHLQSLHLNSLAETNKFVVCYPQGTLDANTGKPYWTGGIANSPIDDVGYLTELAKYLQTTYKLDSDKTFVCGISNGGFMSYALASESPDVFKAMASVTGTMTGYLWKNRNATKLPIPVLQISGMKDNVVPIDGSMSTEYGWGGAPHMDSIINYWARFNQCKQIDTINISKNINAYHYKNGVYGNEVWYYKLDNFGHNLPTLDNSGLASNELIWDFFSNY